MEKAPIEARESTTKLGIWLAAQNLGPNTSKSARTAINNLIRGGLLARDGEKGRIIKGPKYID
jgi:hypothetical protein